MSRSDLPRERDSASLPREGRRARNELLTWMGGEGHLHECHQVPERKKAMFGKIQQDEGNTASTVVTSVMYCWRVSTWGQECLVTITTHRPEPERADWSQFPMLTAGDVCHSSICPALGKFTVKLGRKLSKEPTLQSTGTAETH